MSLDAEQPTSIMRAVRQIIEEYRASGGARGQTLNSLRQAVDRLDFEYLNPDRKRCPKCSRCSSVLTILLGESVTTSRTEPTFDPGDRP